MFFVHLHIIFTVQSKKMELIQEDRATRTGRSRSGRNPVSDKKITVPIYPRMSRIEALGKEAIKVIAEAAIEKEYFKKLRIA